MFDGLWLLKADKAGSVVPWVAYSSSGPGWQRMLGLHMGGIGLGEDGKLHWVDGEDGGYLEEVQLKGCWEEGGAEDEHRWHPLLVDGECSE